jgi:hypothetical protein
MYTSLELPSGGQDEILEILPKCSPTHFLSNLYKTFSVEISNTNIWACSLMFYKTAQRKQSPDGRAFAQSGHPGFHGPIQNSWQPSDPAGDYYILHAADELVVDSEPSIKNFCHILSSSKASAEKLKTFSVINVARALSNIVARASSYLRVELYQVCE